MSTAILVRKQGPSLPLGPVVAVIIVYLLGVMAAVGTGASYDVSGALIVAPVLLAVTIPVLTRSARKNDDLPMRNFIVSALTAKLIGSLVRYAFTFEVYEHADATGYDSVGRKIAQAIRGGDITPDVAGAGGSGTRFIQKVTGWVYAVIGPSKLGGFLVFAWLGFIGLFFFYRAFRLAFPQGDHRRYAIWLFFLPSLLFWPSSIGKEAWMTFCLGLSAYGAARLLSHRRAAVLLIALGLWTTAAVRPHLTAVLLISLIAGVLLRRSSQGHPFGTAAKFVAVGVMILAGLLLVQRLEAFFKIDKVDGQSAESVLDEAGRRSGQGDSAFAPPRVRSPLGLPQAALAVLYRPYPQEAHNMPAALACAEGMALLTLTVASAGRLASIPRLLVREPYVALALVFTVLFIVAFSNIGNFGIIARQRVQVYPFLLVLLAVPKRPIQMTQAGGSHGDY